jgi:hypothetical protein
MENNIGIVLSKLDKVHLHRMLALFINHTGMRAKGGSIRYSAEDIKRRMSFGGDFTYTFGDFFKLVFVRYGMKRSEKDPDAYDTLIYLEAQLDNLNGLRKDDKLYLARMKMAEEANERIRNYLKENELGVVLR